MEEGLKRRKDFNPAVEDVVKTLDGLVAEKKTILKNLSTELSKISADRQIPLDSIPIGGGSNTDGSGMEWLQELEGWIENLFAQQQQGASVPVSANELIAKRMAISRLARLKEIEDMISILSDEFNRLTADVDKTQSKNVRRMLSQQNGRMGKILSDHMEHYICSPPAKKLDRTTTVCENELVVSLQTAENILRAANVDLHTTIVTLNPSDIAFHILAKTVFGAEGMYLKPISFFGINFALLVVCRCYLFIQLRHERNRWQSHQRSAKAFHV